MAAIPPGRRTAGAVGELGEPGWFLAAATDPDGEAVALTWTFDDGATAGGGRVMHAWTAAGRHTAAVTATDATRRTLPRP